MDDLEAVARRLVDWCGLEWEPACLAFHEGRRTVRSASVAQVRGRSTPRPCALEELCRAARPDALAARPRFDLTRERLNP